MGLAGSNTGLFSTSDFLSHLWEKEEGGEKRMEGGKKEIEKEREEGRRNKERSEAR